MTTKAAPQPQVAPPSPVRSFTPARVPLLLRKCACGGSSGGECEDCKRKKPMLQRQAAGSAGVGSVPPVVHSVLNSPGQPLDASTRGFMEPRFGHDFSQVRIHTGAQAAESARAVNAHAYTVGQDIAFDRGRYDPHSSAGRHLLAHELAHTVQQSGLQRSGANIQLDEGAQYQSLEREADATASAVMSGAPVSLPSSAPHPLLSRVKGDAGKVVPGKKKKSKTIKTDFGSHVVKPVEGFETGQGKVEEFEVNVLYVPAEKGKLAFDEYMKIAGGKLESTVELTGTGRARTALWQTRPSTDDLRTLWLEKLGWSADSRDDLWDRAGGDKEFPKVGKKTCQMDHSIELQLGGDNTPINIQPLNAGPNQESGRDINKELRELLTKINDDDELSSDDTTQFKFRFTNAKAVGKFDATPTTCPPGKNPTCLAVEHCAKKLKLAKDEKGNVSIARDDYPISVGGGSPRNLKVPSTFKTDKSEVVKIEGDSVNDSLATLIPGLLLTSLAHRTNTTKKPDAIAAKIDTRSETRLPVSLDPKAKPVTLHAGEDGKLKLSPGDKKGGIAFTYKYLSPGRITEINVNDAGELDWKGVINPGVPLLGQLVVEYSKGTLTVINGLDEAALKKRRVLGMQVTKAQVELQLAPEFKPRGVIELQMGSGKNPLATASLTLEADSVGLIATGKLKVNIPKMETSETTITYKGGGDRNEWIAAIHIKSENIKLGAGFSVTGELTGSIEKEKIDFDGKLDIGLPGDNSAQLGLRRGPKGEWVLYGSGSFKVPKIDRVRAAVTYELEKDILTATVETPTGFKIPAIDLTGKLVKLTVTIAKGRKITATGTGKLEFKKGKAEGSATVTYTPEGKFIGTGSLSYALTPNLTITGTVELDKDERLRVIGQLTFKRLTILNKIEDSRNLFDLRYPIPIPGASIGGIGLEAVLGAKLDAGFSFGAVVIEPLTFEAGFNPLEDDPDLNLAVWGEIKIPASASLTASISGGIQLDVFIAEVGGEIILKGTISLEGGIFIPFKGRYAKKRFTAELTPEVKLGLFLGIALMARVWAKAGIGWLSVKTEKTWTLGEKKVDTGLKFGVKAPISYDSETGIKMPSLSQVELIKPDFSKENLMRVAERIFSGAPASEREV